MPGLIACIEAATRPLLWLDDAAYSERLLAGGRTPWLDGAEYLAFRRKAVGLLKADLTAVPVAGFMRAWVTAHPELQNAMAAKKRVVFPARTLLADEGLRDHLVETLNSLRAAFQHAPLLLSMPSPRALVVEAWRLAFGADGDVEVGGDEADACAVYFAEFLRCFGACGIDGVLLEEATGAEPQDAEELGWYQPVVNVAAHYRWDLGVRFPEAEGFSGEAAPMQFVIAPRVIAGAVYGQALPAAIWDGAAFDIAPTAKFRFASVPADAVPEQVLARLAALRNE